MKKIVLLFLFFSSVALSQTRGISYQALIIDPVTQELPGFNNSNAPLANKDICLKFSFIDELNTLEYEEIFSVRTDNYGMVNLIIGTEVRTGGYAASFEDIQWSLLPKNLKIDLSTDGCTTFTEISNSPFTAVPFALFAVNTVDNPLILDNQRDIALLRDLIIATQIGAGLDADGGYTPVATTFFINNVTSLKEADIVLDNQVNTNENNINTNTGSITTNTSNITTNDVNINNNTSGIATNVNDIATNVTDIATNVTDIATNTTDIATNTTDIATNTTDIATNVTDIATNTTDIATNVTDIATNTTDIATNTTDIATNVTDIATNVTDIAEKLALTGGTMTGNITMGANKLTGVSDPTAAQDAATKAYVDAAIPVGGIIMWYGALIDIPSNWQLCDGSAISSGPLFGVGNNTPDLTNRFIIGADSSLIPNTIGGSSNNGANIGSVQEGTNSFIQVVTNINVDNRPPYYALAYIMRIE